MALEQGKPRVLARVGTWFRKVVWHVADVLESLLNFRKEDELREKGFKTADFAVRRVLYLIADYWLWVLQVSIAVAMKMSGYGLFELLVALWVYDFLAAGFFVVVYEVTGKDLSLGEDFRRAVDTVNGKSRLLGMLATAGVTLLAITWTGPEKVITFFRKEIGSYKRLITVLGGLTALQAFLWALLYSFAYDLVEKLL